jgi:adenylate cyclase
MSRDIRGSRARMRKARSRAFGHLSPKLIDPVISTNRGRVVNTAGDSVLVEFASVVDAARAVIDVQRAMTIRTADFVPEKRIEFRAKESR